MEIHKCGPTTPSSILPLSVKTWEIGMTLSTPHLGPQGHDKAASGWEIDT